MSGRTLADALALVFNRGRWASRAVGDRHGGDGAERWRGRGDEPADVDTAVSTDEPRCGGTR